VEDSKFLHLFLVALMLVTALVVWWKVADYIGSMAVSSISRVVVERSQPTKGVRTVQLLKDFLQSKKDAEEMIGVVDKFMKEGKNPFSPPMIEENTKKAASVEKPVMPTIVLRGIVISGGIRIAVLDIGDKKGVIVKEGEKAGDVRVISIRDGKVVVKWKGKEMVLSME